ncbi:MAG: hypothetical protein RRA94_06320 [Bacteroidota bacterium]|nr:hypothetical protein [Bacteroidota bacterium]
METNAGDSLLVGVRYVAAQYVIPDAVHVAYAQRGGREVVAHVVSVR